MKKKIANRLEWMFLITFVILFVTLLSSCRSNTVYVPLETVKTEYKDRIQRDSIYQMDSIFVDRWKSGDTIYQVKEKYKYLYRDKLIRDSIYINDTIRVPYPVIETKTVKAPYKWYEKILLALGLIGIGVLGFNIYKWIKK